ncbi:MAG: Tex family protein [Bradymonadia bacterium]
MPTPSPFAAAIAQELSLPRRGVEAVLSLLGEGNTVPFVARYRKEATGDLDEVQIRAIEERAGYLKDLADRRKTILDSIESQGKLTDALRARLMKCTTKAELEDIYLPYKPRRRTRAQMARERGLEPLAKQILAQPRGGDPMTDARAFVGDEVPDAEAALAGARDIVAEAVAEHADIRRMARDFFGSEALLVSKAIKGKADGPTPFEQYYDFSEPVAKMPPHRFMAVRRGENEGILRVKLEVEAEHFLPHVYRIMGHDSRSPFGTQMLDAAADAWKRLLAPSMETELRVQLKMTADTSAVDVFAENLKNLLLAAPLGEKSVIGIDPGIRTGCKCAAVDATGRLLAHTTMYPIGGRGRPEEAQRVLLDFLRAHRPLAIAVGNGTGGRETEAFVRRTLKADGAPEGVIVVSVNEAGASVYSASEIARAEFPDLDLTIRGAISIARRLQDPLAELVKIDPKSIGVGQYQHDVHPPLMTRKLGEVVESCVNHVGVELNTASAPLLSHVAGIGPKLADNIVMWRDENGAFPSRKALMKVKGLGAKTFEQAAGFLRVRGSKHPLDASAVHPERYALVERMAADLGVPLSQMVGRTDVVDRLDLKRYVSDSVGMPTLVDILAELKKPGRDPRETFEPPKFREDVQTLDDVKVGMSFEGVVTNVTHFGAFVDIGVHQDGLVHISKLANRFVRDPHEVVKVGDKLNVRVLEIDVARKRISLSARTDEGRPQSRDGGRDGGGRDDRRGGGQRRGGRDDRRGGGRGRDDRRGGGGGKSSGFKHNPFADLLKK